MAVQFQNDTQSLVIAPIEKMVNIIKQLAEDPLEPPDLDSFEEEEGDPKKKGPQLETTMLENTILKIGGLLQVGFGEAGAQIIGKNMSSGDGELNIMMPGCKVQSVFGFVDIREFTDTTECLEEEVMVFVNSIGHIVHKCVHRWSGVANKNVGDAFLVLWKIDNDYGNTHRGGSEIPAAKVSDVADRSLLAFLKIICETRRSDRIQNYSQHPRIVQRFGRGMYRVRFGLGLHVGWAIEGPIGSDFKVDASYLSPHVNICMQLEAGTKTYGLPLLMSEGLYLLLSLKSKQRCRKIDVVTLNGKIQGLYTFPMRHNIWGNIANKSNEGTMVSQPAANSGTSKSASSATARESPGKNKRRQAENSLATVATLLEDETLFTASQKLNREILNDRNYAPPGHIIGDIIKPEDLEVSPALIEADGAEFLFIIDKDINFLQRGVPGYDTAVDEITRDGVRGKFRKALW